MKQDWRWQKAVKAAWQQDIARGDFDVTGTLNFIDGSKMSVKEVRKLLNAYWRSVDKLFYGHAASKGMGVKRWCFLEFGKSGTNLHMQFVARSPIDPELFCCILNIMWSSFRRETADMTRNHITRIISKRHAGSYNGKEERHFRDEDVGLICSHANPVGTANGTFDEEAQNTRICNRLTLETLEQAQQAYKAHMATALANFGRRH